MLEQVIHWTAPIWCNIVVWILLGVIFVIWLAMHSKLFFKFLAFVGWWLFVVVVICGMSLALYNLGILWCEGRFGW